MSAQAVPRVTRHLRSIRAVAAALLGLTATPLAAQRTHALVVTGLGGEPAYSTAFAHHGEVLQSIARTQWRVADSSLIWLAEDPTVSPAASGRSTKEAVAAAFLKLAGRAGPGDVVVVILVGHGSGERADSRVNLPGVDPTAADYAGWLSGFVKQTVVVVVAASGSGDFVEALKGPGRVVITATRSAFERNESVFASHFVRGIASAEADANKDGRLTVMESFEYAKREVERAYTSEQKLLTEHAVVSDTALAARTVFAAAASSGDPRVVALVAERKALEDELAALRARKDSIPAATYETELERILVAIAEKTQAINALGGGRP